ncbi:hypothetical protein X975_00514, partial [Stegodyphus mimosarum]
LGSASNITCSRSFKAIKSSSNPIMKCSDNKILFQNRKYISARVTTRDTKSSPAG